MSALYPCDTELTRMNPLRVIGHMKFCWSRLFKRWMVYCSKGTDCLKGREWDLLACWFILHFWLRAPPPPSPLSLSSVDPDSNHGELRLWPFSFPVTSIFHKFWNIPSSLETAFNWKAPLSKDQILVLARQLMGLLCVFLAGEGKHYIGNDSRGLTPNVIQIWLQTKSRDMQSQWRTKCSQMLGTNGSGQLRCIPDQPIGFS